MAGCRTLGLDPFIFLYLHATDTRVFSSPLLGKRQGQDDVSTDGKFFNWGKVDITQINHPKVNNSSTSSTFTVVCNHHFYLFQKHFLHPKGKSISIGSSSFSSLPPPVLFCAHGFLLSHISPTKIHGDEQIMKLSLWPQVRDLDADHVENMITVWCPWSKYLCLFYNKIQKLG